MTIKVTPQRIPELLLIEPQVFGDERGFFKETFHAARYAELGICESFVQDNLSRSKRGILHGMHLQHPHAQGKLVSVVEGAVFDVAIDVRVGSPTFGQWVGIELSAANHRQLYVPAGFAHGFCVTSESALFSYKCTDVYHPDCELGVSYNDPEIAIAWPLTELLVSAKDALHPRLSQIEPSRLPRYLGASEGAST